MRLHMRVHATGRKYRCPICKFNGNDVNDILVHIGSAHGQDYTYLCDTCKKPFSSILRIKQHVSRCHSETKCRPGAMKFDFNQDYCQSSPEIHPSQSSSSSSIIESSQSSSEEYMRGNLNSSMEDINGSSAEESSDLPSSVNILSDSQKSEFVSSLEIKEELVDRILSNSTTDLSEVLPMETDSVANSMAEIHNIPQDNGGLQPQEKLSQSLNGKDKDPVTACLKSLVVQLERLPKADPGLSIFLETTSPNEERVSDTTKVINIGSVGGVDVCLVGKNSGVVLNLDKKGKKDKKWYMTTELASSVKTAGKVRKSQSKDLSPLAGSSMKLGKCSSRKDKKGVARKKSRSVGRPVGSRKRIEKLVIKLSQTGKRIVTGKKKTPVKSKKKIASNKSRSKQDVIEPVLFNSMSAKGPNMSRNKENPPPVNFDVIVKCERLDLDELNQVSLRRSDVSDKMACSFFAASTTASTASLSGLNLNPTLRVSCDQSKIKRISAGKKKKRKSIYGKRQQSKALDKYTFETLNMEAQVICEQLHPSVLNDIRVLEKKTERKKDAPSTNNDKEVTRRKSKKAKSKSLTKGNVEKDDKEEDFVEESLYIEDIMDSPFQITWKTMRRSAPDGTSQTTNHQSNSTTISSVDDLNANGIGETKSHQQTKTMATAMGDCNSSRFKGLDAKPNCPTPEAAASLSSDIACKKPCSVRVEDIGHVFSPSLSREHGKGPKEKSDFLPQTKERVDLPPSTHTISLNEFEKEYRKKKMVIAKFKVMETPSICSTHSTLERPCPEEDQRQGLVFKDEGGSGICSLKSSEISCSSGKSNSSFNRVKLKQCKVRLDPSAAIQSKLNEVSVSFPEALVPVRSTKSGKSKNRKANAVSPEVIPTNLLIGGNSQWMTGGTSSPPQLKESQPKNIGPKTKRGKYKVKSPKASILKGQEKQTTIGAAILLHQQSLDLPSKQTKTKKNKSLVGSSRLSSSLTQKRQNNETVDADVSPKQTLSKSQRKRPKNCEDSPSASLKKQRISQSKSDTSTSKTSPKKRAKMYINSLALFGGSARSLNKHEEKASAKDSWNRKKNSLSDKGNCISLPSSEDIVNLWRMAFECMTGKSTVKLVDCRRKFALSKSMALASPSNERSRETDALEYRLLVVNEGEKNSALSGDSVFISHGVNVNSEEDMSIMSKEIDSHPDNILIFQQEEVSPVITKSQELVEESPLPSLEGQEGLSNFEEIQKRDVSNILLSVTSHGKESPHSSSTDAQKNKVVIDTCTERREGSFPVLIKTSSEVEKTNLTMLPFKESRPSISMQEFIQANEDHLCKLFPSCQTQLTHEEVLSHLSQWKQLPLPKDFTMGKSGSIRRHSPESCTNSAPISMSKDANLLKESENTQLSVGLRELFSRSEEAENDREAISTTETSMESQALTIAGQIDTNNPQTGFISLQVAVQVHTHEMNREGYSLSVNNDLTVSEPTNIEADVKGVFPNILPDPEFMQPNQTPQSLDPILCLSREETMSSADLNRFPPISNHDPLPMPMDISSCSESEQSSQIKVESVVSNSQSPSLYSSADLVKEELLSVSPHLEFCADDVDPTQDIMSSHAIPFESEVLPPSDDIFMPDELFSFNVLEPGVDIS